MEKQVINNNIGENPLLSLIVPIYNVAEYLPECFESITDQGFNPGECEILCINDGSTDNSAEIVKKYQENNSDIILVNKENGGLSSARNSGLDHAKGKYVLFADPDDYLEANYLKRLIMLMEENNADSLKFGMKGVPASAHFHKPDDIPELIYSFCEKEILITSNSTCNLIVKRSIIMQNSLRFLENLQPCEDCFYSYLQSHHLDYRKHIMVENVIYNYRYRADSISGQTKLVHGATRSLKTMLLLVVLYKGEYEKLIAAGCNNKMLLGHTKKRQYVATAEVLFLAARLSSVNVVDILKKLKSEGAYPYPIMWSSFGKGATDPLKVAVIKFLFPIEFFYRCIAILLQIVFPIK